MLTEAETATCAPPPTTERQPWAGRRGVPEGGVPEGLVATAGRPGRHRAARRRPARRPGPGRLVALYGWATALGAVALASGLRGAVLVLTGPVPQWYQPSTAALGFGGLALGLLALRGHARPVLPLTALGLANVAVGMSAGLTASLP